jgi:hypothetical protein
MNHAAHATGAKALPPARRPRARLALEITIVLLVKFLLLYAIWAVWFAHPASRHLDERGVAATLFAVKNVPPGREEARE